MNIKSALQEHGIKYRLKGTRIIAIDEYVKNGKVGFDYVDVTDFSVQQLRDWLGY